MLPDEFLKVAGRASVRISELVREGCNVRGGFARHQLVQDARHDCQNLNKLYKFTLQCDFEHRNPAIHEQGLQGGGGGGGGTGSASSAHTRDTQTLAQNNLQFS